MATRVDRAIGETEIGFTSRAGLKVMIIPRPGFKKTYATYATHYGSIDNAFVDPKTGEAVEVTDGIAHFLEHKMFERPSGGDVFEDFARLGASSNAYTEYSSTTFLFSTTDRVMENLEILLGFLDEPYFTEANVEKEKGIIEQEIRMYLDMPGDRLHSNLMHALYQKHPVRIDVAGTVESIRTITPDALHLCHRTFYHPSNMLLTVIGDVDADAVRELVERMVPVRSQQAPIQRLYPDEPAAVNQERMEATMPVATPLFLMGYKDDVGAGAGGDALLRAEIETGLMWSMLLGKSSPLFERLFQEGLVNDRFSAQYSRGLTFGFSALGGETPDPDRLEAILVEELGRAPLTTRDLERHKRKERGQYVALFQEPEELAFVVNAMTFRGVDLLDYLGVLDSVRLADIEKRRAAHIKASARSVSVLRPAAGR